jgi:hypothetical protein
MPVDEKNPFGYEQVKANIDASLQEYSGLYEVILVPNITNIFYGRDVGYKIDYIDLPTEIQEISATKIRASMKV